jgi:hypothetical protein
MDFEEFCRKKEKSILEEFVTQITELKDEISPDS